jgi:hypothetical protein
MSYVLRFISICEVFTDFPLYVHFIWFENSTVMTYEFMYSLHATTITCISQSSMMTASQPSLMYVRKLCVTHNILYVSKYYTGTT